MSYVGVGSELEQGSMMALDYSSLFMTFGEKPKPLPMTNEPEIPSSPRMSYKQCICDTLFVETQTLRGNQAMRIESTRECRSMD